MRLRLISNTHRTLPTLLASHSSMPRPSIANSTPHSSRDTLSLSRPSVSSLSSSTISLSPQASTFSAFQLPSSSASTVSSPLSVHSFISNSTTPSQSQHSLIFSEPQPSPASSRSSLNSSVRDSQTSIATADIPAAMSEGMILLNPRASRPTQVSGTTTPISSQFLMDNSSTSSLTNSHPSSANSSVHMSPMHSASNLSAQSEAMESSIGSLDRYVIHDGIFYRQPSTLSAPSESLEESTTSLTSNEATTSSTNHRRNSFLSISSRRRPIYTHTTSSILLYSSLIPKKC